MIYCGGCWSMFKYKERNVQENVKNKRNDRQCMKHVLFLLTSRSVSFNLNL